MATITCIEVTIMGTAGAYTRTIRRIGDKLPLKTAELSLKTAQNEVMDVIHTYAAMAEPKPCPVWQAGDVIAFTYPSGGKEYTLVRGADGWHTARKDYTDSDISAAWEQGRVRHLLRDTKPVEES